MKTLLHNTARLPQRMSKALRNEKGLFDMPSIVVGAILAGILSIGVVAVVFAIIPFAQNKGAQQDLAAISTAQGTYYSQSTDPDVNTTNTVNYLNSYAGTEDLVAEKLLPAGQLDPKALAKIATKGGSLGWVAVARSDSGKMYVATSDKPTPEEYKGTKKDVATALADADLVAVVGKANPAGATGYSTTP